MDPKALSDYQILEYLVPDIDLRVAENEEIRLEIDRRVREGSFEPFRFWKDYK